MEPSLEGWDINKIGDVDWVPWGSSGNAQGKILGTADGFYVVVVQAEAGYRGDPHTHEYAEFLYVIDGVVQNQGQELQSGDGYAAAPGSTHDDFGTVSGATYLSIFKI
jgi:quercetin dioxygenase-like cupin family protein